MSADMSLYELLDLSMGAPQPGTVNFCALRSLLCAILERLNSVRNEERTEGADSPVQPKPALSPRRSLSCCRRIEEKLERVEEQMAALERLPCGSDLIRSKSELTVSEMWQIMQISRKVQANEDGVSQAMALIQDLLMEIRDLREAQDTLTTEVKGLRETLSQLNVTELVDRSSSLEQCCHQVAGVEKALGELQERLRLYPQSAELTQYVSWEVLQDALVGERERIRQEQQEQPCVAMPTRVESPEATPTRVESPEATPTRVESPEATPTHVETPEAIPTNTSRATPPAPPTACSTPLPPPDGVTSPQQMFSDGAVTQTWAGSGAEGYPETVEALRQVGHLRDTHKTLGAHVARLENGKADRDELQALRDLLGHAANRQELDKLPAELSHLKEQVDLLTADREKKVALLSDMQEAVLQLQAECEKLHDCTCHLEEEYSQRQKHIDELYKSMEQLNEKKADKDLVEMEIKTKADKRALETKVSHRQFDEMTEQLNAMLEELLSKVSGQEQDWHKIIEKISDKMDSKLDRAELDSVKKQLEGRWKLILKHLQTQLAPAQDDAAAGIRRQLVNQVHCISCDRPIATSVSGPHLVTVPLAPSFPPHKSSRSNAIYEKEQVCQHYQSEQIPEPEGSGYPPISRRCGGSHTLTQVNRRYPRLQNLGHAATAEEEASPQGAGHSQAAEVDVLGLDGHVYKGRLNSRSVEIRLPDISKDGVDRCKAAKTGSALPQRLGTTELGPRSPRRPHSADSQRSWSVPLSSSLRGPAMSSPGCLCETNVPISLPQPALDGQLEFSQSQEDGSLTSL